MILDFETRDGRGPMGSLPSEDDYDFKNIKFIHLS